MRINPELYKPKVKGESDKFSWNLYWFIEKHRNVRIMFNTKDRINGKHLVFNPKDSLPGWQVFIFIGDHEYTGRPLYGVMDGTRNSLGDYCLFQNQIIDITEWFFKEYLRIGRCIFDRGHKTYWQGGSSRYTQINKSSRKCNWCGKHFHRVIQKETKVIRHETWVMEEKI